MDLNDFLVCPRSKQRMEEVGDEHVAPCGFRYAGRDFRVQLDFTSSWGETQDEYETWLRDWRRDADSTPGRMEAIDAEVADIYAQIPLDGLVLDVAGDMGTVVTQAGLDASRYVSLDTMRIDLHALEREFPTLMRHYAASRGGVFLQGSAEFLPVRDVYFDTVHMRSCLDHFTAPQVALAEAYRVLKPTGKIVVGIALEGFYGKDDASSSSSADGGQGGLAGAYRTGVQVLKRYPKVFGVVNNARSRLAGHHDHHVFHPTQESLASLLTSAGFRVEKEVWPKAYHNVLYVEASKVTWRP